MQISKLTGFFFLSLSVVVAGVHGQAAPTTQPVMDQVQAAIDARQYQSAVKQASKLLSLHGPAAAGISRFQVTMMKGDAQVGMKSISSAITTYKSAAKETQDENELALSKWTAELFHTANSNIFVPKILNIATPKRGPFDLMKMDQRKLAFGALLDDDLSALDPKLKSATASQSLVQIWPVLQQVMDLAQLDEIANGSDDKTTTIASGLLDHSHNLLNNTLKEYWARLGDIDTHANVTTVAQSQTSINGSYVTQTVSRKNGLTDSNKAELADMINTSHKIYDAGQSLMKFSKTPDAWSSILSDSKRVAGRASDVLNADYGTPVNQTDTSGINGGGYNNGYGNNYGGINNQGGGTTVIIVRPTTQPTKPKPKAEN